MLKSSYVSVGMDVEAAAERIPPKVRSEVPFRLLLMGDFSGRGNRGEPPPSRLRPYLIDRDNFDQVLARVKPELELGPRGRGINLRFRELEDFHPDNLYQDAVFDRYREARRQLPAAPAAPKPSSPLPLPPLSGNLLDDVLEATEGGAAAARRPDELRDFIERATAPYKAPREDPRLAGHIAEVDAATGKLMRAILHDPHFQALEAAWRAVYWLVRGLETGPQLKLYVLDIGKADLAASLHEIHRLLVDQAVDTPGAEPWAMAAANYSFTRNEADLHVLSELGAIMRAAGAPVLAEADPADPDTPEAAQRWNALRHSADASWIGLALPRFLLRLPYGEHTSSVESFAFEEMPGAPEHQQYLWGNPAFACAYLLAKAFTRDGWDMRPGSHQDITGLPLHSYEADGETQLKPCAEVLMTEHDAEAMLDEGFMLLASIKDQDAARLVRFQSIADPAQALNGRWH